MDKNKTNTEIARLVGVSEKCVRTTRKNYEDGQIVGELPKPGRPNKLTARDKNYIYLQVRKNPRLSHAKLAADFNSKFANIKISKQTVQRALKEKKIFTCVAQEKPLLTKNTKEIACFGVNKGCTGTLKNGVE